MNTAIEGLRNKYDVDQEIIENDQDCLYMKKQCDSRNSSRNDFLSQNKVPQESGGFLKSIKGIFSSRKPSKAPVACFERPEQSSELTLDNDSRSVPETFTALLSEEYSSLSSLVGKEFTLTTPVSVEAVGDGNEPNVILRGSIPFTVKTPNGVKRKKVRVLGKLYNARGDLTDSSTTTQQSARTQQCERTQLSVETTSVQSKILIKLDPQFTHGSSISQEVHWEVAERYPYEQYYRKFVGELALISTNTSDTTKTSLQHHESTQLKQNLQDSVVPLKSITLTRVRMKVIKYNDGSEVKERCGKEKVTLKVPSGIFYKYDEESRILKRIEYKNSSSESKTICYGKHRGTKFKRIRGSHFSKKSSSFFQEYSMKTEIKDEMSEMPLENSFTQDAYYCVSSPEERNIFETPQANEWRMKDSSKRINVEEMKNAFYQQMYFPLPQSHYRDDIQGYCPLTWLYNSYDKTKSFIRGFMVNEKNLSIQ